MSDTVERLDDATHDQLIDTVNALIFAARHRTEAEVLVARTAMMNRLAGLLLSRLPLPPHAAGGGEEPIAGIPDDIDVQEVIRNLISTARAFDGSGEVIIPTSDLLRLADHLRRSSSPAASQSAPEAMVEVVRTARRVRTMHGADINSQDSTINWLADRVAELERELAKEERQAEQLIIERDQREDQVTDIYLALGGTDEWSNLHDLGAEALPLVHDWIERSCQAHRRAELAEQEVRRLAQKLDQLGHPSLQASAAQDTKTSPPVVEEMPENHGELMNAFLGHKPSDPSLEEIRTRSNRIAQGLDQQQTFEWMRKRIYDELEPEVKRLTTALQSSQQLAEKMVLDEREACAKLVEWTIVEVESLTDEPRATEKVMHELINRIRARSASTTSL